MKQIRVGISLFIALAAMMGEGCRSLPKPSDDASFTQEKKGQPGTCKVPQRISFVPPKSGRGSFSLSETERASGAVDDSDFSLNLMPSDLEHIRSLSCNGSTCEVAVSKPIAFTSESRVDLTANFFLRYETTRDESGALLSREVTVGGKKAHISMGKILGVDVEVGAFFKQDLQKKGLSSLSSGAFVEASSKTQFPLLNLRGKIVAEGLNMMDLHVKGIDVSLIHKDEAKASQPKTPISKDAKDLRDEILPRTGKAKTEKADLTWSTLAEQCAERFYGD